MYNLNTVFPTRQIYLDSRYGTEVNNHNTDIIFKLNEMIEVPKHITILMSLVDLEIPLTYYIINDTNNTLNVKFDDGSDDELITLINGDYDGIEIAQHFWEQSTFESVKYNTRRNKLIFIHTKSFTLDYETSLCFEKIGFDYKDHVSIYDEALERYYVQSDHMVMLSSLSSIYIHSPSVTTNNISMKKGGVKDNIIEKIPVDTPSGSVLIWRNLTNHKTMIIEKVINSLEIKLTDENDNLLDLNAINVHWSATIQLDFVRLNNTGLKLMQPMKPKEPTVDKPKPKKKKKNKK